MRRLMIGAAITAAILTDITGNIRLTAAEATGAVYTATNNAAGNEVLMFDRTATGALTYVNAFSTGGTGTSNGLGNQGALRLTADGKFLLVVNAGSNDVSVLEPDDHGLTLRDRQTSGGLRPVSVTVNGRLVYVLNAGGSAGSQDVLVGFRLSRDGHLAMIPGSARGLSATSTEPAQVDLSPDGTSLIVTEKATNRVDLFSVDDDGRLGTAKSYSSSGATPFGFAFGKHDQFFVSEAFGGALDASAVSAYQVTGTGGLTLVSPSIPTTETSACWVAVSGDGRFLYSGNAASGTVSGFRIRPDGTIALMNADGVAGTPGSGVADLTLTIDGRYLYALRAGAGAIAAFRIEEHGSLSSLGSTTVPVGLNGIVAR